jgi:hypothetical protein
VIGKDGTVIPTSYEDAAWHRKPSGFIYLDDKEVACTMQCAHCGGHFVYRRNTIHSGCANCRDGGRYSLLCDNPSCHHLCKFFLQKLDEYEKGTLKVLR